MEAPTLDRYKDPNRLADVMALIQVLALGENVRGSEAGLAVALQGSPKSADSWTTIARQHPEYFRVAQGDYPVSLLARYAIARTDEGGEPRAEFSDEFTGKLLESAISLYDREVRRKDRTHEIRRVYIPIAVAIIAGFFTIAGALIRDFLS